MDGKLKRKHKQLYGTFVRCGRRPEMEDDVSTIPSFLQYPTNSLKDDRFSPQSTAHFFGGCNGHGGSQRKKRLHYQEIVDFGVYTYTYQKLIHGFYQYIYFREALATTKATITSSPRQILLFRHELKSKRIKKIKSTTYHRLKNKDLKNSSLGALMDPAMAKEEAMRQEAKRVEEHMTLKHKNTGKWAKRMLSRGPNVKYDGTKAAIAEQLQMNANLSRKMNSMRDGSSSDERDDEEELKDGSDEDTPSRLIAKAKEKTLKALEDDELPNAVLMSLPFMKNEEANEEAKCALEEYEEWENSDGENSKKAVNVSGRRVFGATAKVEAPKESRKDSDNFYDDSDSDNDMAGIEDNNIEPVRDNASPARNTITETEKFDDDVAGNPAYKTTFDVAMFASGSWKKMTGSKNTESKKASKKMRAPIPQAQDKKDSESEAEQMVDRVLTSASKETFVVPSQAAYKPLWFLLKQLINRAFAGDNVLDEFEKDKDEVLNQEVHIYTYIRNKTNQDLGLMESRMEGDVFSGYGERYQMDGKVLQNFQKRFVQVQYILEQNRLLINEINQNHESKQADHLGRNVRLIRELNNNIRTVASLYGDLSHSFARSVDASSEGESTGTLKSDGKANNQKRFRSG
ncbi:unnamed protein product [Brassica oleracea]